MSQTKITWETLTDVRFEDKYFEEKDAYFYYPYFGNSIKALQGKEVILKGYVLVLGSRKDAYILSRYSYAECYFCGGGGPESIVELQLPPDHSKYSMDQIVTFKGTFKLNRDDIYHCNYIFENAEEYKPD